MAKRSVVNREAKRRKLIAKYAARRKALKDVIRNLETEYDEREAAQRKLNALPRNSCPVRV